MFPRLVLTLVLTPTLAFAQSPVFLSTQQSAFPRADSSAWSRDASSGSGAVARSVSLIKAQVAEAKRQFKSRQGRHATAAPAINSVTLAALDPATSQIHLLPVSKDIFLQRNAELTSITSLGSSVRLRVVRANGVNTAIILSEATTGRALMPLVVEYPIERGGSLREMAYYTSAHPALLTPEVVFSGKSYVRTMLDQSARRLRRQGVRIAPEIVDVAERLCIVEHTDHKRFRQENRRALFEEIFSLYGLNGSNTYRYSVSSAGAGGMVQMIPSTYEMVRQLYPNAGLDPDFVEGMSDHANALEAMLLYMQRTWDDLVRAPEAREALKTGIATPAELLAAGYNSNPARLPLYLRRGGAEWRTLIPSETQMYLQIYSSLDRLIPMNRRAPGGRGSATAAAGPGWASLRSWQSAVDSSGEISLMGLLPSLNNSWLLGGSW